MTREDDRYAHFRAQIVKQDKELASLRVQNELTHKAYVEENNRLMAERESLRAELAQEEQHYEAQKSVIKSLDEEIARLTEVLSQSEWRPIETAPKPTGNDPLWIIGFVTWGPPERRHKWVGPCEWVGKYGFQFTNHDFDAFPTPTHWTDWPEPPDGR